MSLCVLKKEKVKKHLRLSIFNFIIHSIIFSSHQREGDTMFKRNLFAQIIGITALLILLVAAILGGTSYWFAQKELTNSGKLDLMHMVNGSVTVLNQLNESVENGELTLEEAKEKARVLLIGPKVEGNEKLLYDYSKSPYTYKKDGYLFVYNSESLVEAHPTLPIGEDKSSLKTPNGEPLIQRLIEASKMTNPDERYYEFEFPKAGETKVSTKIAYTAYFEPWDWVVVIGAYEDEFKESIHTISVITVIISLVTLLLGVLLMFFLLRNKLRVLKIVTSATVEVSNGNLAIQIIDYKGKDEVGQIAAAFNKMTAQLRNLVQNIQTVSEKTSQSSLELSALSEETSASSEEIGRAMNEITQGAVNQTADIEMINEGTESLAKTMHELTSQNNAIDGLTKVSQQAVTNGRHQVTNLQQANVNSKQALGNVNDTVQQLNQRVAEIAGIVTTIKEIADQTNLLALNASIEAARAGDHGKGFAVVAEEVRKLAEETNSATNEIQSMIKAIKDQTSISVEEMSRTIDFSKQLDSAVQDTESEFGTISETIQNIITLISQSSENIQKVDTSMQKLNVSVQSVSGVSEETSAASEEVMASVEEQIGAIRNITSQSESLNNLSEELNQLIKTFKV